MAKQVTVVLNEKPDLLALSASEPDFFPALFESQSFNEKIGRYDILFAAPSIQMVAFDEQQLSHLLQAIDCKPSPQTDKDFSLGGPFQWGWMVYFAYESAYLMEPKLAHLMPLSQEPLAVAIYCQGAVVHDRVTGSCCLYAQTQEVADSIHAHINTVNGYCHAAVEITDIKQASGAGFKSAVKKAKDLIIAGDIYQANLSRKYHCHTAQQLSPAAIMAQLRQANPAPFAGLLQIDNFAVVSSSPERLFSVREGVVETRPIAGTRPRGKDSVADQALIVELLDTPKERAEHIMLIDLERNDMGKVCQVGTVEVDELMVVESYQHVHHIVSNIKGQLKADVSVVDVIKALFPGGTITGCPKIRCMEVIREIEGENRGCYTGSMGYINHDGQVDFNILIRTVAMHYDEISFNAGAGIVFDSDPESELLETKHKAQGMLNALSPNTGQFSEVKES